jgi:signal transduction histidine kinase
MSRLKDLARGIKVAFKSLALAVYILGKAAGLLLYPLTAAARQLKKLLRFSLTFKITTTYALMFSVLLFLSSLLIVAGVRIYLVYVLEIEDVYTGSIFAILSAVNAVIIIITLAVGTRVSRRMLMPIKRMTDTVKEISVQNLDKRLDVGRSHDELKDLAQTFNQMIDRIQSSYERQNRFVSDASHELRTPVAVIQGYADLLDRWGMDHRDVMEESVNAIKDETGNMKQLIEKLLFLARADKNQLTLKMEEFVLDDLLEEIASESRLLDTGHIITCRMEAAGIEICADRSCLKQALRVFMDNAIKYTPSGGVIEISALKTKKQVTIAVTDTGIGIPTEDIPLVFDRFYRSDLSRTRESGGHGLGLSIAKWIIESHDGKIEVQSAVGKGTRISIHLPCKK